MSGMWVEMRAMMSVFDGLCRPFFVFCVMMMRSVCMHVSCSSSCGLCYCAGVWMWGGCVVFCGGEPRLLWLLCVGVWLWV